MLLRIAIVVILVLLLGVRFWVYYKDLPEYRDGQVVSEVFVVASQPVVSYGKQSFKVSDKYGTSIRVVTGAGEKLNFGDRVFIEGVFTKKHSLVFIYFPKFQMQTSDKNILTKSSNWIKNRAQILFKEHLSPNSASLLLGMIFGGKYGMDRSFEEDLRVTGVLHVIAASGMNVTFVTGALIAILSIFLRRQFVLVVAGFGVVFYMFLAGFEESIVRAGIMALLAFGAGLFGRQYFGIYALAVTFYLMIFYNPSVLFEVGFQLSFLATLGILTVKPLLDGFRGFVKLGSIGQDLTTTLAAQAGVTPVLLSVFGSVGILSIPANLLVLWVVPIVMGLGALGLIAGIFFEPLGALFLYLSVPLLWYFEQAVSFFGGFGLNWVVEALPWEVVVGYYLVGAGVLLFLNKRRRFPLDRNNDFTREFRL
jgi:competence protein ComEC